MTAGIRPAPAPAHPRARTLILAATVLLALVGCSDPGTPSGSGQTPGSGSESAGTGAPVPGTSVLQTFNLSPDQNRLASDVSKEAVALVPAAIGADGKLTVAVSPGVPPLASYASDNTTVIGNEVDIAYALGDALGLEVEIVPTAWADWPLGVESGKYEVALSNITVTEARREKFILRPIATTSWAFMHGWTALSVRLRGPLMWRASA